MSDRPPRATCRTLRQRRESRIWCMLVAVALEDGMAMGDAVDAAAVLIEDEPADLAALARMT